jgi:hypothetical protein
VNEVRIVLSKDGIVFKNEHGEMTCIGDRNVTIHLREDDHILNQIAKKLGVNIRDIIDCFGQYDKFFEQREIK